MQSFFSAYWADVEGGKEFKDLIKPAAIIAVWTSNAIQCMEKQYPRCFVC